MVCVLLVWLMTSLAAVVLDLGDQLLLVSFHVAFCSPRFYSTPVSSCSHRVQSTSDWLQLLFWGTEFLQDVCHCVIWPQRSLKLRVMQASLSKFPTISFRVLMFWHIYINFVAMTQKHLIFISKIVKYSMPTLVSRLALIMSTVRSSFRKASRAWAFFFQRK